MEITNYDCYKFWKIERMNTIKYKKNYRSKLTFYVINSDYDKTNKLSLPLHPR